MGTTRHSWTKTAAAGTVALLLLVGGAIGIANLQTVSSASAADPADPLTADKAADIFAGFADPQTKQDAMPGWALRGDEFGIVAPSTRFLGSGDTADYWLALDGKGNICLASVTNGTAPFSALTCHPPETVLTEGIPLQFSDQKTSTRSYFVPDGYVVDSLGYTVVGSNVLVTNGLVDGQPIQLSAVAFDGGPPSITLRPMPAQPLLDK